VIAPTGQVPSIGLPLLIEIRCFPTARGVGQNPLDVSLAINSSALPAFRAYSTGGTNRLGATIRVDPDTAEEPQGGFNPLSAPPGLRTPFAADNTFYVGELDFVPRVSRLHTAWIDTNSTRPDYVTPVVEPAGERQPLGTDLALEYRGATAFDAGVTPFDAASHNAYGEPRTQVGRQIDGRIDYFRDNGAWTADIHALDGARYLQVRVTFLSNMESGLSPELDALGLAFAFD
jgi:hypothetical protein